MRIPEKYFWPIAGALAALALAHIAYLSFLCDDAFIAFRYARNLHEGHGLVFNPGERVEGFTSPGWVMICAAMFRAGGTPEHWAVPFGGMIAVFSLLALSWHQNRCGRDYVIFGVLTAACGGWAAWATGGLETSLFTALVSLAFAASAEWLGAPVAAGRSSLRVSGALLGAATLVRPEGALIAGLVGLGLLGQRPRAGRELALWGASWIVPVLALLAWRHFYYGGLVPNTFRVKATGVDLLPAGLDYLGYSVRRLHLYFLAVPFVALLARRGTLEATGRRRVIFAASVLLPYLAYVASVGGDFMDMFRFVVPVLPIAFLVTGEIGARMLSTRIRLGVATVGLGAYVALNFASSHDALRESYRHQLDSIGLLKRYVADWSEVGRFLGDVAAPSDTLATTAAGCIPYYSRLHTIDQLGLVAPDLDGFVRRDVARPGHSLQIGGEELLRLRPHYVLGSAPLTPAGEFQLALYIESGWEEEFAKDYRTASITPRALGGRRLSFAVREDAAERFQAALSLRAP